MEYRVVTSEYHEGRPDISDSKLERAFKVTRSDGSEDQCMALVPKSGTIPSKTRVPRDKSSIPYLDVYLNTLRWEYNQKGNLGAMDDHLLASGAPTLHNIIVAQYRTYEGHNGLAQTAALRIAWNAIFNDVFKDLVKRNIMPASSFPEPPEFVERRGYDGSASGQ